MANEYTEYGNDATRGDVATMAREQGNKLKESVEAGRVRTSGKLRDTSRTLESWSERVAQNMDMAKEKTNAGIKRTSSSLERVATYLDEHDTQAMMEDTKQMIRHNPGKAMIVGVVFGFMMARIFR